MRHIPTALALLALLAAPAFAGSETGLTTDQVFSQLGGYSCSGSSCTHGDPGSRIEPQAHQDAEHIYVAPIAHARCGHFIGHLDANCVSMSIAPQSSGGVVHPLAPRTVTTVVTTTKVLTFNGPDNWTIDTSSSSVDARR
jgi:hypothetical protein